MGRYHLRPPVDEICEHAGFTRREAQVALLMAERFTYIEIASDLGIRPNTACRYCERVLQKLGVSRRQEVAQALVVVGMNFNYTPPIPVASGPFGDYDVVTPERRPG